MTMQQSWGTADWSIEFVSDRIVIRSATRRQDFTGAETHRLEVARRWLRWQLVVDGKERLKGLSKSDATMLAARLKRFTADQQRAAERRARARHVERLRTAATTDLLRAGVWHRRVSDCFDGGLSARRWIPYDDVAALASARPASPALRALAADKEARLSLSPVEREALTALDKDLDGRRRKVNDRILQRELTGQHQFLTTIEKSPLTEEQAHAVICFDNRVQVIAAAGSGKTSVMVARAAYAIRRGFVPARRILLLAFNANAASELEERIDARLKANGIDTTGLRAATFHSFGLSLIGQATGEKPRLAPWLDNGQDLEMVERIVDELRDSSHSFRYKWDLYRLLFARTGSTPEGDEAEWWDPETKVTGHRTLQGETVKSQGEKLIADWLFLNGVTYEYERAYEHAVADTEHSQYRPDFYYPDIDVWHEHWAIGRDGKPPKDFVGYAASMKWKKQVHQDHLTTLVETTWAEIVDRSGFEPFEERLRSHGVQLDWNPDRPMPRGARPVEHRDLAKLVRSFMSHVKSNALDRAALAERLASSAMGVNRYRSQLFVDIYWEIHDAWEERLGSEGYVDFEDMLVKASQALETGAATSSYDLVLVDEFQDSSTARARLVKALVQGRNKFLLTVGDDWQSIYRFAGSDISMMTEFEQWFGPSETLRLQKTFRSTQTITEVASTFVSKNPRQLSKKVTSAHGPGGAPIMVATVTAANPNRPEPELAAAVEGYLRRLSARLSNGEIELGHNGKVSVDVLGRYGFERDLLPHRIPEGLTVQFRTIHRAKGLESDYVLLPRVVRGVVGFPSQIEDDPVLDLVMAHSDPWPFGEERRLLYVALTRARREVALITVKGKESPFVVEMLKDGLLTHVASSDDRARPDRATSAAVCPECEEGLLTARTGRYGTFWGCGRFPACKYTTNRAPGAGTSSAVG